LRHTNRSIQPAVHQLEESAELIAAMARELKAANEQISNGTTEQVLSIQRTNESGERVRVEAQSHAQAASRAQSTVSSLTHLLGQVQNEVETMVGQMREVSDTSEKIKRLSAIVESIAFQTHILSLNASIEAARSGEAGRGFEVVANEVKTLARQSSEAARETADLIAGSLSAVANGSASLGQIVSSVGNVTSATAEIDRLIRSIESSSQQQAGNAGSIARALTDIETVSTRTAAAAEEVFAQQAEMAIQAQHLDRVTKTLRQLIGRGSSV
jgi:methyl-accepting chemotaxis protein